MNVLSRPDRRLPMTRVALLAVSLGMLLSQGASAARWFDNLPADDPDIVVRRSAPPSPSAAAAPSKP